MLLEINPKSNKKGLSVLGICSRISDQEGAGWIKMEVSILIKRIHKDFFGLQHTVYITSPLLLIQITAWHHFSSTDEGGKTWLKGQKDPTGCLFGVKFKTCSLDQIRFLLKGEIISISSLVLDCPEKTLP